MRVGFVVGEFGEFFEFVAEWPGQLRGDFDEDSHEEIAQAVAVDIGQALTAETEHGAVLGAGGDFQAGGAVKRGDFDLATERGGGESNRHFAQEVIVLPDENLMFFDTDDNVEITVRAATDAGFAVTGTAEAGAVVNAGRDFDFDFAALLGAAFAAAFFAGVADHLAGAIAARTGRGDGEKPTRVGDLAAPVAGGTGFGLAAGSAAAPVAFFAGVENVKGDFFFDAFGGFLEFDFEVVPEIVAAAGGGAFAATTAESLFEDVLKDAATATTEDGFKDVARVVEAAAAAATATGSRAAAAGRKRGVTEAVVGGAFLRVGEGFVGFAEFLEFFLSSVIAGIFVGMIFDGELAVGFLDVLRCRAALDAEHFVVIAFGAHAGVGEPAAAGDPLLTTTRAGRRSRSPSL
ncbi:MAG: hypothetical protein PCFJNLEI_00219 [Verrucomicrobiae bacterium]|nr:hypothetical protein [Verrucomicrobiae bacterium]